ncbi:MAG: YcxB family protein [Labedaea sp.]
MSESQIELRWDPTPRDWADGLRATMSIYRFAPWFAAAFGFAGVVLLVLGEPLPGVFGLVAATMIAALPVVGVWVGFHRNPVAATTMTAKADERSLRMMTVDGTAYSDLDWEKLSGWLQTGRGFVLRTGSGRASPFYPVPNRAFGSPAQRERFRELLARRLGPASRN